MAQKVFLLPRQARDKHRKHLFFRRYAAGQLLGEQDAGRCLRTQVFEWQDGELGLRDVEGDVRLSVRCTHTEIERERGREREGGGGRKEGRMEGRDRATERGVESNLKYTPSSFLPFGATITCHALGCVRAVGRIITAISTRLLPLFAAQAARTQSFPQVSPMLGPSLPW